MKQYKVAKRMFKGSISFDSPKFLITTNYTVDNPTVGLKPYKVTTGIFKGHVFFGEIIKDRVYDGNSVGQSFPIENVEEMLSY